jgi:zinc protease
MKATAQVGLAPVREVLGNGAVIIAKETRTAPAMTIHAAFRAGTVCEPVPQSGIAHFMSRTIDRGTGSRTAEQIADEFDGSGVSLAISVNRHSVSLVCTCLAEDFEKILALMADVAMHPTFPEREVATRRGEIITLIRQDEDNPGTVAVEGLLSALYGPSHPYGRRPRGTVESVEAITRDALVTYHAQRFAPSALSLVMVGDIEPARAVDVASAAFREWNARPSVGPPALPSTQPSGQRQIRVIPMMNKAQADIAYGFVTILRSDPQYYAYWLMNNILGQYSLGGRLGNSIRERQGMAYYVYSSLDANVIPGPLLIRAGVSPVNVDRAVASIDAELATLAAEGPTEREIQESKQYLSGSMPRNLETNVGIANFLQMVEFFNLGLDYDVRVPLLLASVTQEQVVAAARHALDPSKAAVVIAGPYSGAIV